MDILDFNNVRQCKGHTFTQPSETFDDGSTSLSRVFENYLTLGLQQRRAVSDSNIDSPLLYDSDFADGTTDYEMDQTLFDNPDTTSDIDIASSLSKLNSSNTPPPLSNGPHSNIDTPNNSTKE